ncbi:MAG: hypothetical protein P8J67_01725 [Flavobacteriaceae bacterium]|nr:hypothetical protein [Flavobacteriaceae bacterium]
MSKEEIKVIFGLIFIAILTRLLPHPPNFAPITSIALFSGFHFSNKRIAILIPLVGMFLSDIFLGLHSLMPVIYLTFILISVMSFYIKTLSFANVLLASTLFFVFSNLGVWYFYYPHNWGGLSACFVLAIPFFVNAIAGDLFYTSVLQFSFKKIKTISFSL